MATLPPQKPDPDLFGRLASEHPILALMALIILAAVASILLLYQHNATIVLYENF